MPDPEFNHGRRTPARDAAPSLPSPGYFPRVACPKCSADLTLLPKVARFCNRCGVALSPAATTVPVRAASALPATPRGPKFSRPRWLFNLWFACLDGADEAAHSASVGRSAVLLAYGKSLFNLGWRYEHAVGARRNLTEAARCYWKAARLGDPSAVGRLEPARVQACRDPVPAPCPLS